MLLVQLPYELEISAQLFYQSANKQAIFVPVPACSFIIWAEVWAAFLSTYKKRDQDTIISY